MAYVQPNSASDPIVATGLSLFARLSMRPGFAEWGMHAQVEVICLRPSMKLASAIETGQLAHQYIDDNRVKSRSRVNLEQGKRYLK
jgi:hypothetical protein